MAGDLYWDSVGLALHCDDVGLTDVKGTAMTLTGVVRSSTESVFGGYSAYFDGASELLNDGYVSPTITEGAFSAQFWVNPSAQTNTDPCVFRAQDVSIEYKPTGFGFGLVLSMGGVRTQLGIHPENTWHYVSIAKEAPSIEVWIDGQQAFKGSAVNDYYDPQIFFGGWFVGSSPDTGFVGYVDDILITPSVARTDHSIPASAFPEFPPDPEGAGSGAILVQGVGVGDVPAFGRGSGAVGIRVSGIGSVPPIGVGACRVRITGSGAGTVGRTFIGSGLVRIAGSGAGSHGRFGVGNAKVRVIANGVCKRGNAGASSSTIYIIGTGIGSTLEYPVGVASGVVRIVGFGVGAPGEEEFCA